MPLNLSPTARSVLLVIGVVLAAVIPVLVTAGVPVLVTAAGGAIVAAFVGLGIVPPQVGGTQKGVVSPAVEDSPQQPANVVYPPAPSTDVLANLHGDAPRPDYTTGDHVS